MVRFLEKRQGTLVMYARPDHFHNFEIVAQTSLHETVCMGFEIF